MQNTTTCPITAIDLISTPYNSALVPRGNVGLKIIYQAYGSIGDLILCDSYILVQACGLGTVKRNTPVEAAADLVVMDVHIFQPLHAVGRVVTTLGLNADAAILNLIVTDFNVDVLSIRYAKGRAGIQP